MSQSTLPDFPHLQEESSRTTEQLSPEKYRESLSDHPDLEGINISEMELEHLDDGWQRFPHPDEIRFLIDEDHSTDDPLPKHVRQKIDESEPSLNEFFVFSASEAYDYLETLQHKSDLHLETFHRQQLIVNQLSNGRGYAKGASLSLNSERIPPFTAGVNRVG